MKATERLFYMAFSESASSYPAQLFKVFWSLRVLSQENKKRKDWKLTVRAF